MKTESGAEITKASILIGFTCPETKENYVACWMGLISDEYYEGVDGKPRTFDYAEYQDYMQARNFWSVDAVVAAVYGPDPEDVEAEVEFEVWCADGCQKYHTII